MPLTPRACLQLRADYMSDTFSVVKGYLIAFSAVKGYLIALTVACAWHMSSTVLVAQAGGPQAHYCAKMLFILFISA